MSIGCKAMLNNIKKLIVLLVFILICTDISSYENSLFIDYNRTLKSSNFSFLASYDTKGEEDVCTGEMLGKSMETLVTNVLYKNISQNSNFKQLHNIIFFDMALQNLKSQFLCVEILIPDIHLLQMDVTEYIHKIDGKKREVL